MALRQTLSADVLSGGKITKSLLRKLRSKMRNKAMRKWYKRNWKTRKDYGKKAAKLGS